MPRLIVTHNDVTKVVLYDVDDTFDVFKQKCISKFNELKDFRVCLNRHLFPEVEGVDEIDKEDTLILFARDGDLPPAPPTDVEDNDESGDELMEPAATVENKSTETPCSEDKMCLDEETIISRMKQDGCPWPEGKDDIIDVLGTDSGVLKWLVGREDWMKCKFQNGNLEGYALVSVIQNGTAEMLRMFKGDNAFAALSIYLTQNDCTQSEVHSTLAGR